MTTKLINDLSTVSALMRLAWANGDMKAYDELVPMYQRLVSQQVQHELAGGAVQ